MPERWELLFTLPNLTPPEPTPFESDGYVICSSNDPRLPKLDPTPANVTSLRMLRRFRTPQGKRYTPGCFLVRSDIAIADRQAETLRAFRNVCAIATTSPLYAVMLAKPSAAQWRVAWADQFRFGRFIAGLNGWVQPIGGPLRGMDDSIPLQQADGAFGSPTGYSLLVDTPLLERLLRAWRKCYIQKRNRRQFLQLFRALEIAFHASLFPADGLTSINDVGTRIGLWVSAFEVLCHPGTRVNKRHVQDVIRKAPFTDRALIAARFTVTHGSKHGRPVRYRATLPEALYDDLYSARNQFFHGNPVREAILHYRESDRYAMLTDVAPVLFNAALVTRLNALSVPGAPMEHTELKLHNIAKYMRSHEGVKRVSDGLVAAGRPRP